MAINSRRKGKVAELEAAKTLRDMFGWSARRRQQFSGHTGEDDLVVDQTPSLFWEVKWVQALNVPQALAKAVMQAGRKCAVVMHRRNRDKEWMLTLRLRDLPRLVHAYDTASHEHVPPSASEG